MNFLQVTPEMVVGCFMKGTYLKLFFYNQNTKKYQQFYVVQRYDYGEMIGATIFPKNGQRNAQMYVPISLTDKFKSWLSENADIPTIGIQRESTGSFSVEDVPNSPYVLREEAENHTNAYKVNNVAVAIPDVLYARASEMTYEYLSEDEYIIDDEEEEENNNDDEEEEENNNDDEEEEENNNDDENEKDYSKLIWIALGAAALLL